MKIANEEPLNINYFNRNLSKFGGLILQLVGFTVISLTINYSMFDVKADKLVKAHYLFMVIGSIVLPANGQYFAALDPLLT